MVLSLAHREPMGAILLTPRFRPVPECWTENAPFRHANTMRRVLYENTIWFPILSPTTKVDYITASVLTGFPNHLDDPFFRWGHSNDTLQPYTMRLNSERHRIRQRHTLYLRDLIQEYGSVGAGYYSLCTRPFATTAELYGHIEGLLLLLRAREDNGNAAPQDGAAIFRPPTRVEDVGWNGGPYMVAAAHKRVMPNNGYWIHGVFPGRYGH
jgi:hypothetical protein